jgi:hypothetical protein
MILTSRGRLVFKPKSYRKPTFSPSPLVFTHGNNSWGERAMRPDILKSDRRGQELSMEDARQLSVGRLAAGIDIGSHIA